MKLAILATAFDWLYRFFTLIFPVKKNKITFCSNRSEQLTGNLAFLYNEIKADDAYAIKIICFNFERSFKGSLKYLYYSLMSIYHIATSRVFIIDDYFFPIYCLKKKRENNTIVQVWHAIGHLKKYGLSIAENRKKSVRPHTNYDWVFANSVNDVPALVEAFDVTESQVIVTGSPRIDPIVQAYNHGTPPNEAKSIMYAPTYRNAERMPQLYNEINQVIEEAISSGITKKMKLYVSLHPYIQLEKIKQPETDQVEIFQDSQRSSDLLPKIVYLVTDYSSILLDYTFFERPILIYAPDYQNYIKEVGFFVDYKKYLAAPFYRQSSQLWADITSDKEFDLTYVKRLKADNFSYTDGKNALRCATFIQELMKAS